MATDIQHVVRHHAASFKRKGKQMGGGVVPVNAAFFAHGKFFCYNNFFFLTKFDSYFLFYIFC